jgi:hypothetical protein
MFRIVKSPDQIGVISEDFAKKRIERLVRILESRTRENHRGI